MTKARKQKHKAAPKPKAIIQVLPPQEKPWMLSQDEITIIKNSIAKGATDDELKFCLTVARRYRLDPFKQQIWFIQRWDKNADNGQGGTGAKVWIAQVGIYGMAHVAARDHADYGTIALPEYGPMIDVEVEGKKIKGPEWARVKVFKRGIPEPAVGEAWFEEYCPKRYENTLFWRTMPHRMIAKCAKAQGIREAYPDLGGLHIPEEMHRMDENYTESGRQITEGVIVGTKEAAQAVAQHKIAEYNARQSENKTKPENGKGSDSRPSGTQIAQSSKERQESLTLTPYKGMLALSGAGLSIVRAEMTEDDKAFFGIKLIDRSVFCLEEKLFFKFQDLCTRLGVKTTLVEAAKSITPKKPEGDFILPRAIIPPAPVFPDQPAPAKSTDPILFSARQIGKQDKKPFMDLDWNGKHHSVFDKGLWPILLAAVNKPVMLETKTNGKYSNLVRIVRVDGISFE